MQAAAKCAILIILSPFLCESWVVFFLELHVVYLNSENRQKVWDNLTHRAIRHVHTEFPCVSGHRGNQDPAAVSYQVKLLDRKDHSDLAVVVSTGTTSSQDLDHLIMPRLPEHQSQKTAYSYPRLILSKFLSFPGACHFKIFCLLLSLWTFARLIKQYEERQEKWCLYILQYHKPP